VQLGTSGKLFGWESSPCLPELTVGWQGRCRLCQAPQPIPCCPARRSLHQGSGVGGLGGQAERFSPNRPRFRNDALLEQTTRSQRPAAGSRHPRALRRLGVTPSLIESSEGLGRGREPFPSCGSLMVRMACTHRFEADPIGKGRQTRPQWRTLTENEEESAPQRRATTAGTRADRCSICGSPLRWSGRSNGFARAGRNA
jgi:hypothetical protein